MKTQSNLLFGLVALQNGAVDADRLAETCAEWSVDRSVDLPERLVKAGCLTIEQKTQIEGLVEAELNRHGGDPDVTLAANVDGRFLEAIRAARGAGDAELAELAETMAPGGIEVISSLGPGESEANDRYTRTHLHAKGGMGQVWVARDGSLGRQIALKELRPDQSGNATICSRFVYEARVTAQLEHPGIVPVYEMGGGSVPYYTMRFVKGRTLGEATRAYHKDRVAGTADPVGLVNLVSAFVGVCHAIAYAHSKGVIHRDLKGQNVMVGDFGEVIVLDWGLAKQVGSIGHPEGEAHVESFRIGSPGQAAGDTVAATIAGSEAESPDDAQGLGDPGAHLEWGSGAGPEATMQGQLLGTPGYMAPEQAEGRVDLVDQRTDVYGLGAVLYEILTGEPPFSGKKTTEILQKVRQELPRSPRELNTSLHPALQAICLKALAKRRDERYATAIDLAQDVQRFLADEPVQACPETWSQQVIRWARRHRTAVATAAGLLITTTIALGIGTVLVARERNEAKVQGKQARQAVDDMYTKVAENWLEDRLDPLQKEFLEKTLAHYETFTGLAAREPAVQLEHGKAYQRMGDIHRKLGRLDQANDAFRRALELLEPLHTATPADDAVTRALGLTRTRLGDLLVRRGQNDQADPLYRQAADLQRTLAAAPGAAVEDQWLLARTLKSQADLMRRRGEFAGARPVYHQAIDVLEKASAAAPAQSDVRNDLALTEDALGLLLLELGDSKPAEEAFRRALALLEPLIAEFPTVPRFREALAKATNSLGMIEQGDGRWADGEAHYRRELAEADRLAQDFPDRPEFRREVARACGNLGGLLSEQSRGSEAEPILRRGITLNRDLAALQPTDAQIRLDLARCRNNLGCLLLERGGADLAIAEFQQARELSAELVRQFPDAPRYRFNLAGDLRNLGRAYEAAGRNEAEASFRESLKISEPLTAKFPENVDYQIELNRCLNGLAGLLASAKRADEAEPLYLRALAAVDHKDQARATPQLLREQADVLTNMGEFRREAKRPGAEESLRRAISISEQLTARKPATRADRQRLAIAQNNLAEVLENTGRSTEAGEHFVRAIDGFESLARDMPKAPDTRNYLGYVYEQQGKLLAKTNQAEKAKLALEQAVKHQRQAIKLTDGKVETYRRMLAGHLSALAEVCLKIRSYDEAYRASLEIPKGDPGSGEAMFDAARLLARCMLQASGDAKLDKTVREDLDRKCMGRIVVLLRDTIDIDPKLLERIKADSSLSGILSRPEFKGWLGNLAEVTPRPGT